MKFICSICGQELPHFKGLLDHYKKTHPDLLKRYQIKHIPSTITLLAYSPNASVLIKAQGWNKQDCASIKEVK